jgi:hypothetical protein
MTRAIRASTPKVTAMPTRSRCRPNGMASTIMIRAWTRSRTTSRSERPRSIAVRLIGVTRIRSTTP